MHETWSETGALAPAGPSLAQLMLARGAQLPQPTPATAEQAVTAAELVAEAEQIAAEAACACASGSCRNAHWHTVCRCTCGGHAHGETSRLAYETSLAKAAARREALYGGDVFGGIPVVDLDVIPVQRGRGLSAIAFDADGWPID
jgi:hypothetical protein